MYAKWNDIHTNVTFIKILVSITEVINYEPMSDNFYKKSKICLKEDS